MLSNYLTKGEKMEFKIGNKVKVKTKTLSKMSPALIKKLNGVGVIISPTEVYVYVRFSNGVKYWFHNRALELIKNQQLLFEFMV